MRALTRSGLKRLVLLFVFMLSGAAGLIYEVLWTRRLTLIFGSTTLAVSTVLAAYMGGLALGAFLLGRWADRNRPKALRTYGWLELAIAVMGLAVPFLLRGVAAVYLALAPALESFPTGFFVIQFLLVGAVLAVPCALMGGTLPLLARWLVGREEEIGGRVAGLYAANTLGAGLGTAAATYVLLPNVGVRAGELWAVLLNLTAGLAGLCLARLARPVAAPPTETEAGARAEESSDAGEASASPGRLRAIWIATGLSGFAAMVDEVTWARLVGMVFGSSVYAFGLVLLLFLAGIAIGSAAFSRMRADPQRVLGAALLANTAASLLGLLLVPHLPTIFLRGFPVVRDSFFLTQMLQILETAPALLPAAILFGICFPAAVAATADLAGTGRAVGRVTVWNTVGTVAGAFLGGFVLIPVLGLRASLVTAAVATAAGGTLVLGRMAGAWRRLAWIGGTAAVAAALLLPPWPKDILTKGAGFFAGVYVTPEALLAAARDSELLFYKDGIATTLSVDKQDNTLYYRSNGKTDASTDPGDMANQLLLGHLPMLLHSSPRDVFVLGLGTGVTAASVARYPVRTIDIADIESSVRDAARLFAAENRNVLDDPRVRLLVADGRNALLARSKTYDVIISDPSDVWVAGVGNLFTSEFYTLARSRLRPGGVMVQWFHMHELPAQQLQLIVATFRSVFPYASLWRPNRGDVILIGTFDELPWDRKRLTERGSEAGVAEDLRRIGFWNPLAIFSAFVLEGEDLSRMLANVRGVHSDDHPVIEYLAPRAGYEDTTSVNDAGVQALQTKWLPPIAGFEEARDFDARSRYLLGFGMASIGRVDPGIRLMEQSVQGDPPDPKFFTGLANQYRAKGWTAKAIDAYAKALERGPTDSEAALRLAELRRAQGNDAEAERILRATLSRVPSDAELGVAAARLLVETGRPAEALPLLDRAREAAPTNAEIDVLAGNALADTGRREEAVKALRRAAETARDDLAVQRSAASLLMKLEDLEGAAAAYLRASELLPSAESFAGLARVASRRGDAAAFRSARQRALELDPYNAEVLALPQR